MYMSASAPDAPPFSDTTIGCFIRLFFCTADCIMRAIWSEAPPAPAATTISTGLVGSQACAGAAAKTAASVAPTATHGRDDGLRIMGVSSDLLRVLETATLSRVTFCDTCTHCATIRLQFKPRAAPK